MSVTKEDYLRKQEVLKLWGQIVDLFATKSSVTTLQGYFTDGKAKKAIADGDGNTISTTYLKVALKGAHNGLAELDANGLVPSSQLPSYVDDVLEYASKSAFPATGTTGKIYVALDTNLTYRWSGSAYTEISPSLALGETSSTAYRGDRGKTAYTHATDASRLTTAESSGFYKFATTAEGHIASVTAVTASDITTLIGDTYQVKVSKLGSTTKPLYTSAAGTFAECSTYAGGTKVTLNGTSKAASTASFYAPTGAGTSGQVLKSTAGAPEWVNQSTLTAGALTTVSKTAWGKTFWTANGVPDSISGDMTGVGDVKMDNDKGIYIKDYTANTYREVLKLDYTDLLSLGYETGEQGYDTSIWGSQVILSAYDGSEYQDIVTAKVENGTNKLEVSGNLMLTKSSYTSNGLSLDASGNMKVSDGARLTDIYGSAIKFYIGSSEAAAIDSANKNLTSQGSVIGLRGVAAYGIADLSIISNS